jgi:hypothetical protein
MTSYLSEDLTSYPSKDITLNISEDITSYLSEDITLYISEDITSYLSEHITSYLSEDITSYLSEDITLYISKDITTYISEDITSYLGEDITWVQCGDDSITSPSHSSSSKRPFAWLPSYRKPSQTSIYSHNIPLTFLSDLRDWEPPSSQTGRLSPTALNKCHVGRSSLSSGAPFELQGKRLHEVTMSFDLFPEQRDLHNTGSHTVTLFFDSPWLIRGGRMWAIPAIIDNLPRT